MEHNLQPGDACHDCAKSGLANKLRFFHINFNEQILKCESNTCLYPHNEEISSDECDAAAMQVEATTTTAASLEENLLSCAESIIADLLKDSDFVELDLPVITSTDLNMPSLDDDAQPSTSATAELQMPNVPVKPKIDIQSIETIKQCESFSNEQAKPPAGDSASKATPQQTLPQASITRTPSNGIPKARISHYMANIKRPKDQPTTAGFKNAQRKTNGKAVKKQPVAAPQMNIRTDDVLKLLQQKKKT